MHAPLDHATNQHANAKFERHRGQGNLEDFQNANKSGSERGNANSFRNRRFRKTLHLLDSAVSGRSMSFNHDACFSVMHQEFNPVHPGN